MTREEAINYAEAIKAKTQEKIEFYRRGNAHAPEVYYSDLAFLSAAISALREQEERRWIPVTERLPDIETEVMVIYAAGGHQFITTAMYEDGTVFTEDSEWNWNEKECWCEYDEERDDWRIPEGWFEYRHFNPDDVYNNLVDCPVTHWMPLPEAPKEG